MACGISENCFDNIPVTWISGKFIRENRYSCKINESTMFPANA